jgi:hypothetical protein
MRASVLLAGGVAVAAPSIYGLMGPITKRSGLAPHHSKVGFGIREPNRGSLIWELQIRNGSIGQSNVEMNEC